MPSQERVARALQDRYRIEQVLGRGGSAVVYLASDLLLQRPVAIKVVRAGLAAEDGGQERLLREAHMVARLQHPNIVQLYDVRALDDDGLALIMQFVEGPTLKEQIVAERAFSCRRAGQILVDVARALGYAHALKIVHRDVKPENVHHNPETGTTHLSDFGIARRWGGASTLTLPGSALGTPAYMSPEQIDGRELDGRSDLYSLALLGYELLTGRSPWKGDTLFAILEEQKRRVPLPLAEIRTDVPAHLSEAIGVALRKDPQQRWPNADAFVEKILAAPLPDTPAPALPAGDPTALEDAPTIIFRKDRRGATSPPPRPFPGDRRGGSTANDPPSTEPPAPSAEHATGPASETVDPPRVRQDSPSSSPERDDDRTPPAVLEGRPSGVSGAAPSTPRDSSPEAPALPDLQDTPSHDPPFLGFALPPPPPGEGHAIPEGTEYYTPENLSEREVHHQRVMVKTDLDFARVIRYDLFELLEEGDIQLSHGDCGGNALSVEPSIYTRTRRGKLRRIETGPDDPVFLQCQGCDWRLGNMTRGQFEEAVTRFLTRPQPSALEGYRLTEEANLVEPGWKPPRRRRRPDRRAPETRYDVDPSLMGRRRASRDRRRDPDLRDLPEPPDES